MRKIGFTSAQGELYKSTKKINGRIKDLKTFFTGNPFVYINVATIFISVINTGKTLTLILPMDKNPSGLLRISSNIADALFPKK